ncbi:MAG: hypothetical protein IKM45_04935 [Opitutales bacterium]|nr:hypothetical protein [Opitutales bacterium]
MRQLIFTSALSGLASGRSGFCTVARHASLRERTVAELERMSEYKPPAGERPTVFLFRVYSGGNEPLYILTRAGDAGTDDFGRANYVVHHLIFRRNELEKLLPPAEIALRFQGWCKKFEGEPRYLPEDEPLPPEILRAEGESLLPAKRWEELTGDAGNAALLCPHGDARATIFLGDETCTETVLGLFAESSEALGGIGAWGVAFSTGICSENGAGRFLWRRLNESEISVRRPGDLILDFLAPLEFLHAPQTRFAAFARTGIFPKAADAKKERKSPEASEKNASSGAGNGADVADQPYKRFADIAGTAKFLGISAIVVAIVIACVVFWGTGDTKQAGSAVPGEVTVAGKAEAFRRILDQKINSEDFISAAEVWLEFARAFPQDATRLAGVYLPRFKLKVADAYAKYFSERIAVAELAGGLSAESRRELDAKLARFRRVCEKLDLTPQRLQKKNVAVFEKAEALLSSN